MAEYADPISIRLRAGQALQDELDNRCDAIGRGKRIKRDLKRYYQELLAPARFTLAGIFTPTEIEIIAEAIKDDPFGARDTRDLAALLWDRLGFTTAGDLRQQILYKTRHLSDVHRLALIDAIEQARSQTWTGPESSLRARLQRLCLLE